MQELWDLPQKGASWAAAGYQGAISSGKTTCGLLIGSGAAIGLKLAVDNEGNPQEHEDERGKAIGGVLELYKSFLEEYGETTCKDLIGCDLSIPEESAKYRNEGIWKEVCDVCLNFVMNKCNDMAERGKI